MPLEPPHDLPPFPTSEELIQAANRWASDEGYGIVKRRPSTYRDGVPRRWDLHCSSGEAVRSSLNTTQGIRRRAASTKVGCPWRAKAIQRVGSPWVLEIQDPSHNHGPSPYPALDITHRRRTRTATQRADVRSKISDGIATREIASMQRRDHPRQAGARKDIQNERDLTHKDFLSIYTPTQGLLAYLDSNNIAYQTQIGEDNKLNAVFWCPPWCEKQWRRFPDILGLDNTYKTNRFNMPLLNITCVTNIGSTFNIGFALVMGEDEEAYEFTISALDKVRDIKGIRKPQTIITGFDIALKNALGSLWPDINQQICLRHVSKNIINEIKKSWVHEEAPEQQEEARRTRGHPQQEADHPDPLLRKFIQLTRSEEPLPVIAPPEEPQVPRTPLGFLSIWKTVIYAKTEADFEAAWLYLLEQFPLQEPSIQYLQSRYLPWRRHFVVCYTQNNRNFGVQTMSLPEGSHKEIKSCLFNSSADLFFFMERIEAMIQNQGEEYRQAEATEVMRQLRDHKSHTWLGDILTKVSRRAQTLIIEQYRLFRARITEIVGAQGRQIDDPSFACTHAFRRQFGLPCSHEIERRLVENRPLSHYDVDTHWHLRSNVADRDTVITVRDPTAAPPRGRPVIGPDDIPIALIPAQGGGD